MEDALGSKADALQKQIKTFNDQHHAVLSLQQGSGQTNQVSRRSGSAPTRTMCNPIFVPPDCPVDHTRMVVAATKLSKVEFESEKQPLDVDCKVFLQG